MIYFIISLFLVLYAISKSIKDTLDHHWHLSFFERMAKKFPSIQKWLEPSSWENKYRFKNVILDFLWRGPLVFLTDGSHFFQLLKMTSWQTVVAYLLMDAGRIPPNWIAFLVSIAFMKVLIGSVFEVFYKWVWIKRVKGYNVIANHLNRRSSENIKTQTIGTDFDFESRKQISLAWIELNSVLVSSLLMVGGFLGSYVSYTLLGGTADYAPANAMAGAITTIAGSLVLQMILRIHVTRKRK